MSFSDRPEVQKLSPPQADASISKTPLQIIMRLIRQQKCWALGQNSCKSHNIQEAATRTTIAAVHIWKPICNSPHLRWRLHQGTTCSSITQIPTMVAPAAVVSPSTRLWRTRQLHSLQLLLRPISTNIAKSNSKATKQSLNNNWVPFVTINMTFISRNRQPQITQQASRHFSLLKCRCSIITCRTILERSQPRRWSFKHRSSLGEIIIKMNSGPSRIQQVMRIM